MNSILVRVLEVIKGSKVSSCREAMYGLRTGTDTKVSSQGKYDSQRMFIRRLRTCDKDDPDAVTRDLEQPGPTDKRHVQGIYCVHIHY